jgi:hypothetical protein
LSSRLSPLAAGVTTGGEANITYCVFIYICVIYICPRIFGDTSTLKIRARRGLTSDDVGGARSSLGMLLLYDEVTEW